MYTFITDAVSMAQSLRVLLVEDSKVLTERLTEAIRQIPQVELIGTADTEATAVASAKRDSIDVIILDLHLKQGTGFGVMRALATAQLKPRIIVLRITTCPNTRTPPSLWAQLTSWTRRATTADCPKCCTRSARRISPSTERRRSRRVPSIRDTSGRTGRFRQAGSVDNILDRGI